MSTYKWGAFQIDSEISGAELQERELTAWDEDETTADAVKLLSGLDEDADDWDQFEVCLSSLVSDLQVNQNKFGVKSTYDEGLYTTKLDKDSSFYKERVSTATRLAQDIQKVSLKLINVLKKSLSNLRKIFIY